MLAVAGQTIDTSAYNKMSAGFVCLAKTFINIALAVGDLSTDGGSPPIASFLSPRALEPLNFFPGPEFNGREAAPNS
jgi:hypothetical protein